MQSSNFKSPPKVAPEKLAKYETSTSREEMVRFIPVAATSVLDIGCGDGKFGELLKSVRGAIVWGVEPEESAAQEAKKRLDKVVTGYFGESIEVPDEHFDVVVFNDCLEHLSDPWGALRLAKRKLVRGGVVVSSIPNIRYIENLEHLVLDGDFEYEDFGIRDRTHLRFFTKKSMVRLFESCGYDVIAQEGIREVPWDRSRIFRRLLFKFFAHHTEDMKFLQFAVVSRPRAAS